MADDHIRAALLAAEVDIMLNGWEPQPSSRSLIAILIAEEAQLTGEVDALGPAMRHLSQAVQDAGHRSIGDWEIAPGRRKAEVVHLLRQAQALVT